MIRSLKRKTKRGKPFGSWCGMQAGWGRAGNSKDLDL